MRSKWGYLVLKIREGGCVGKSVLFQLMTGLLSPDTGTIRVNGNILGQNNRDFPEGVGILINEPGYIEYYSGYKNLQLLAAIQGKIDDDTIPKIIIKKIAEVSRPQRFFPLGEFFIAPMAQLQ